MENRSGASISVIDQIVQHDYCIGCGLCVAICPEDAIRMAWGRFGTFEPVQTQATCQACPACLYVCPFADGLAEGIATPNEDALGAEMFGNLNCHHSGELGFYRACYAGHAPAFRQNSSSGGIGTWILSYLLETRRVDKVICVQPNDSRDVLFRYRICSTPEEVYLGAKTRYYPVHIADILEVVLREEARYALIGLPCTLKGLRLAQARNPILRERIVFCAGIFCGGLKTAFFTEYLAACVGVSKDEIADPQFRMKDEESEPWDSIFGCATSANRDKVRSIKMRLLGDMWGTGLFKPNACDYCDDITAELADLSIGDAWIPPYVHDWRGTSLVITRSALAQQLIKEGLEKGQLVLEEITPEQIIRSQAGNYNHRRKGLAYRLYWAKQKGCPAPKKRVQPQRPWNPALARVHRLRMRVRSLSHEAWIVQRDTPGTELFNRMMRKDLADLQRWTRFSHLPRLVLHIWAYAVRRLSLLSGRGHQATWGNTR